MRTFLYGRSYWWLFQQGCPVVKLIMAACLAQWFLQSLLSAHAGDLNGAMALFPDRFLSAWDERPWAAISSQGLTLFTYMFAHTNFPHLLTNLTGLTLFAPLVESILGARKFLLMYVLCGAASGMVYLLAAEAGFQHKEFLIGASGAVAGVVGIMAGLLPCAIVHQGKRTYRTYHMTGLPVLLEILALLYGSFVSSYSVGPHWVHLGGLVSGVLAAIVLKHLYGPFPTVPSFIRQ